MEFGFHANMLDSSTEHVANALHPIFEELSIRLAGDYATTMEHLWIDLELIRGHSKMDGTPKWPFRVQKRVSGHSRFGLPAIPDKFNVGHYSVVPDYQLLQELDGDRLLSYVLNLVYSSFTIIEEQKKRIGNFNIDLLRSQFVQVCEEFEISIENG